MKRPLKKARVPINPPLSARDVEEALEERISTGKYPLGQRLPPVRDIAAEFGTSPSTVSRALQEMMRSGWLEVYERRFVRVRDQLPSNVVRSADIQRSARAIAHKWKLKGGSYDELIATLSEIVADVFKLQTEFVFTECNPNDLNFMAAQLAQELPDSTLNCQLIKELDKDELERDGSVILVPYFHYAEVRKLVGDALSIVPIHFKPSVETLDKLLTIRPGSNILVFGRDQRSVQRLSLMVREYVDAKITGITIDEREKLPKLAKSADAVVTVSTALETVPRLPPIKQLIEVRFELETSLGNRLKNGPVKSAAP